MDTRKMAAELRLSHWAEVLRERKESGLSVRRWCRENGVQEKTYYYWQRKLRENACERLTRGNNSTLAPVAPAFAQVSLPTVRSNEGNIAIRIGGAEEINRRAFRAGATKVFVRPVLEQLVSVLWTKM